MRPTPVLRKALPVLLVLAACERTEEARDQVRETAGEGAEEVAARVEDELMDRLECQEIARPSTLGRMREARNDDWFEVQAGPTNIGYHEVLLCHQGFEATEGK